MSETETITQDGDRYEFYAGPFDSLFEAYDFIDARIELGELGEDEAIVDHATGMVYRLMVDSPSLSPK